MMNKPSLGDALLADQDLEPHDPDARHLMQEHERALKGAIGGLNQLVINAEAAHQHKALTQVGVPELVRAR